MQITKLLTRIRFAGLRGAARAVWYALNRDIIEGRHAPSPPGEASATPGPMTAVESQPSGAVFRFERAALEVRFLAPDLVRITWEPGTPPLPYAIARADWSEVRVDLRRATRGSHLASEALAVEVSEDGALAFRDSNGRLLREELAPDGLGGAALHRARLRPEECILGLGNRSGSFNLRGRALALWNRDPGGGFTPGDDPLYLCVPVYLAIHSEGSYLIFYENAHRATLTFSDDAVARFAGGALRYYVIAGPPARALDRYSDLTGRPPLPPRWALGYHHSRWSFMSEGEVREVVNGFHARDLPISAIHLDIDYMDGFRIFTVDRRRFPDLKQLTHELLAHGIHTIPILDPGVKREPGYAVFDAGREEQVFCTMPDGSLAAAPVWPGWSVFPDFTDARARAWWGRQHARLVDLGVSGFWHDMNEPAAFGAWGESTLPLPVRHSLEGRGGDHREAHNVYGLLMNRAGFEALRTLRPQTRPFILTRSGWAGVQRYAWTWTGDIEGTWEALRQTVATVLGLGLSGVPFAGPDIGGFKGAPPAELYLRWFQMAAFLPFFRTHSAKTTPRREPWVYGDTCLEIIRAHLTLRDRLMPYLYTMAWEASRTGWPLARPLFWPDAEEADLWGVADEFLLGDALLVAPVLEDGARVREVVLPKGLWYDLGDNRTYTGPGRVTVDAPLERIPVLVRGGTVLPMDEGALALHLYPDEDGHGRGMLFSDLGDGYAPGRVDRFRLTLDGDASRLEWAREGEFAFPYPAVDVQVHGRTANRAVVDGTEVPCTANRIRAGMFAQAVFWITRAPQPGS